MTPRPPALAWAECPRCGKVVAVVSGVTSPHVARDFPRDCR